MTSALLLWLIYFVQLFGGVTKPSSKEPELCLVKLVITESLFLIKLLHEEILFAVNMFFFFTHVALLA